MILLYQDDISCFFLRETRAQEIFKNNLGYICTTIFLDSIFIGLSALLKALSRNFAILSRFAVTQN